jgi:hypothetical protein
MQKITVTKVQEMAEKPVVVKASARKSQRTYPRSSLKTARIIPVSNPSKSPPLKKTMRKHTIRLLTNKGVHLHRKKIKKTVRNMSDDRIRTIVEKSGLIKNKDTPIELMRSMVRDGMIAGFIST